MDSLSPSQPDSVPNYSLDGNQNCDQTISDGSSTLTARNLGTGLESGNCLALGTSPSSHDGTLSGLSSEDVPSPRMHQEPNRSRLSRRRLARTGDGRTIGDNLTTETLITTPSRSDGDQEIQISFNNVKLNLLEALRDKKAYSSAFVTIKKQKDALEKEVRVLPQQNEALEIVMNSSKRSKNGNKHVWSLDNLRGTNLANYQGISLAAGELAKVEAMVITTETYVEESENRLRKRNWTASATVVNANVANSAKLYVTLPNGSFPIPASCMYRAMTREHYISPFRSDFGFARYSIRNMNHDEGNRITNVKLFLSSASSYVNEQSL